MANVIRGDSVSIELEGKEYSIIFDMNAIANIEEETDCPLLQYQEDLPAIDVLRTLLKHSLVNCSLDIDKADLRPIIQTQNILQSAIAIAYFGTSNMDEIEEVKKSKEGITGEEDKKK